MARESRGTHALVSQRDSHRKGPQRRCPTANGLRERGPVRRKILREYAHLSPHPAASRRHSAVPNSPNTNFPLTSVCVRRSFSQRVAHEVFKCVVGIFLRLPIGF